MLKLFKNKNKSNSSLHHHNQHHSSDNHQDDNNGGSSYIHHYGTNNTVNTSPANNANKTTFSRSGSPTENNYNTYSSAGSPPPNNNPTYHHNIKPHRSKSFLGFQLNKNSSNASSSYSIQSPVQSNEDIINHNHNNNNNNNNINHNHHHNNINTHSSMVEIKRFFRPHNLNPNNIITGIEHSVGVNTGSGNNNHLLLRNNANNRDNSRSHFDHHSHTQSAIPPSSDSTLSLGNKANIYHDDAILAQKYGKLGKVLGSGAGGSVRIITRPSDGVTFAVKEFRPRKADEPVKEYAKKCTAEFCIGSTLHHPNIIETLDIFSDAQQNKYYEVMEYCPVDFFAVVMSGKMSRNEINCCFKQLMEGVKYLHSMGLAHRDLKLDNCVMTSEGILKLIDFGSAVVFKYPYDNHITLARGIVGSDPYLAPEVLTCKKYDPQPVDIWSMGIIYCCMVLKRFPWKSPSRSDKNFHLFCLPDEVEHDYVESAKKHAELLMKLKLEKKQKMLLQEQQLREKDNAMHEEPVKKDDNTNISNKDNNPTDISSTQKKEEPPQPPKNNDETKNNDEPKANDNSSQITSWTQQPEHHHHHHHETHPEYRQQQTTATKKPLQGPYRLFRLLPHAARPILSKVLEVDQTKRATLEDIFKDEWFINISYCTLDKKGHLIRGKGHTHTIVKEEDAHLESYKEKK
ncbi:related to Serine/threonine-protein kinase HRK1 [Saccharomycodes ludwigii]|uniref:non-specific serine/threonine protein kinase n=1 Tax=Saccharomycodes ludwigii TaxID=36035 RepID=A0A376B2F9_9ASCO|nr:hypothetical protein SCDLUD_002201 [Saccharomycodes ludwigii]KAH3902381.1 hypothetical protein SCDLUD_002201 [Saccharomycodes ludwigii]SSD58320.1 related to Serine/threonine-protein kinase HRK1 [Saccharomycodes ludwigii]